MPVDPNISLQAGTGIGAPQNPLNTIGQFAQVQNALNQSKMFPLLQQRMQLELQQQQLSQTQNRMQAVNQFLAPLVGQKSLSHGDIISAIGGLKAAGLPTGEFERDMAETMPTSDGPELSQWFKTHVAARALPPAQVPSVFGQGAGPIVDNGDTLQGTTVTGPYGQNPGVLTPAGKPMQKYLSPSELASQQSRPATQEEADRFGIPVGTPVTESMLERLQQQGQTNLIGPSKGGMGGVTGTGGPVGPNNPPRLASTPPAATVAPPPAAQPAAGRPVVTGLPPAAPSEIAASTEQYNAASANANTYRQRIFPLEQAGKALLTADTGPGSETVNKIKSFLLAQTPASLQKYLPGVDPNKIADYDEAVKYLANYAMQQPGASRSDMSQGLAQVANASTHISNQAARQVVQNALGIERMQQAAITEFNRQHPGPGAGAQYNRWQQSFVANHDPRGFIWDDLSAAQRQQAIKGMSADDKRRLLESVQLGRQLNLNGGAGG